MNTGSIVISALTHKEDRGQATIIPYLSIVFLKRRSARLQILNLCKRNYSCQKSELLNRALVKKKENNESGLQVINKALARFLD